MITSCCLVFIILDGHVGSPAGSSLPSWATILSEPSESGRCSFKASSGGAVIQVSTSSGVVRITGIALGWIVPTSAFGSVVRNAWRSLVVSPSLTFRTEVQSVQMPAKQARGRVSSSANHMSPPSTLLNSLKELKRHHAAVLDARASGSSVCSSHCGCWSCRRPAQEAFARRIFPSDLLELEQIRPPDFGVFMDAIEMWFIPKASPLQIDGPIRISEIAQGLDETLPVIARARWRRYARERRDRIAASAMRSSTRWALGGGGANAGQQM